MIRKSLLLTLLTLISISAMGQVKFFVFNTDGVNLREKPSTSSNRLLWLSDGGCGCWYSFEDPRDPQLIVEPARACEAMPYVSWEQKGEWTELRLTDLGYGYEDAFGIEVWVMTKFLTEVKPTRVDSIDKLNKALEKGDGHKLRTKGKLAGILIKQIDDMDLDYQGLSLSLYNICCPVVSEIMRQEIFMFYEEGDRPLSIEDNTIKYSDRHCIGGSGDCSWHWDINKFTDKELNDIVSLIMSNDKDYELTDLSCNIPYRYSYYFAPSALLPTGGWANVYDPSLSNLDKSEIIDLMFE